MALICKQILQYNHMYPLSPELRPERFLESAIAGGMTIARFEAAPTPLEEIFMHVVTKNALASA